MEETEKTEKIVKKNNNSSYWERFQFQLQVNDNIICQRYFKIPRFNYGSLESEELYDTLDSCVSLIQRDLESKSRVYLWNSLEPQTKLTGFASKMKAYKEAKERGADSQELRSIILGHTTDEDYVVNTIKEWDETEFVKPWDVTFKFIFMVDDKSVYERIWDGSQYPKYVRNSVDITNAKSQFPMVQLMNSGKKDIAVEIINNITGVCSNGDSEEPRQYTKSTRYGDKKIYFSATKEYFNSWRDYCAKKYAKARN